MRKPSAVGAGVDRASPSRPHRGRLQKTNAGTLGCIHPGKRCDLFYAHPFRASERGSNENANRIVRRFIPKGADISQVSQTRIQQIEDWMNALPRKILDGLSAEEKVNRYFEVNAA